jgi:predicted site-specific integrase-resolvase
MSENAEEKNQISKEAKEVENYFKNPEIGIDTDKLTAFVDSGKLSWKINPNGHTKIIRDKIIDVQDQYKKDYAAYEKLPEEDQTNKLRYSISEKCNKAILEIALPGFNYDEMVNDTRAGPQNLL